MPRDIPVGNGQMLVTFDHHYRIRDLYYPHVGQENHAGQGPCRFGVWSDLPEPQPENENDRRKQRLFWSDQGWEIEMGYQTDTLASHVVMRHSQLALELTCNDVVDFHRSVMIRKIVVKNLVNQPREVHLFSHNDFAMYGTRVGDTAYYDPLTSSMVHYRAVRYLMTTWYTDGKPHVDQYAAGFAGFRGAEGTWRDAEDGQLGNNPIAQGAVDSTIMLNLELPPSGETTAYLVIGAGKSYSDLTVLHQFLQREGPQGVIDRTTSYWRLWLAAAHTDFPTPDQGGPSGKVVDLFKRSLLIVRTQIDNSGAIIAANDSDIMQFSRDTYSYLWPRDGALVANALDTAGMSEVARSFYGLCAKIITEQGYFLHKYNPDGSPASSWHPWVNLDQPQLPIQEDETSLVLWALWNHYAQYRDIEFVRSLWVTLITKAADFLVRFRDPVTKLPLPSYDLWEERWGVHAFTVGTVYGGLQAAWQFAVCFGDTKRAATYAQAASETREAFIKYFWCEEHERYMRRIVPLDHDRTAKLMADVMAGREPLPDATRDERALEFEHDHVIDSATYAIYAMGMLDVHDPRVEKTMQSISKRLWIDTPVGGVARYENDYYHRISDNIKAVPGNPWFICTLWLAQWHIAKARTVEELSQAMPILDWVADRALPSGVLAEQVHPHTNSPLSVSPLTWSHATVVATLTAYVNKYESMTACPTCGQKRMSSIHKH